MGSLPELPEPLHAGFGDSNHAQASAGGQQPMGQGEGQGMQSGGYVAMPNMGSGADLPFLTPSDVEDMVEDDAEVRVALCRAVTWRAMALRCCKEA